MVEIEIDEKKLQVPQGQLIIEAADEANIPIPRFCYHKKLSIAANCRMCLVEVEKSQKPVPACATPVSDGMKIYTTSYVAKEAQKAVMEFLLINHPLDCPICDQGGQCELQDIALVYGKDYSRFDERKRVVKDKNIGPLISTDMTRCIHCTRCVRFGTEIAGQRELGATGRGEFMQIGTFIEKSVNSEISGNVIDLCPVGALTSKPFRFLARAWEIIAKPSISPHDCIGSHLFFHTFRGKVIRALPREKSSLNEVWLSDRDRYSYEGFNHPDRLQMPWIKRDKGWEQVGWDEALNFSAQKMQRIIQEKGAEKIGAMASPNSTLEEFYLLQKLLRAKGCHNIDHRLRHIDCHYQDYTASYPSLGITLPELEQQDAIILIGSDVKKEQPLINLRIRKATLHGGHVFAVNPWEVDFNFSNVSQLIGEAGDLVSPLIALLKGIGECDPDKLPLISQDLIAIFSDYPSSSQSMEMAKALLERKENKKVSVILGQQALIHPKANLIYGLSRQLATLLEASWGEMSFGANSAGGWIAGAVPHRFPGGEKIKSPGLALDEMLQNALQGFILLHCEPQFDCANPQLATKALENAEVVIALSAYDSAYLREHADVLLPCAPISETAGTYVNAFKDWQSFEPVVEPLGECKPAWKVLRVLANLLKLSDFDYQNVTEVLDEIKNIHLQHPYFAESFMHMPISIVKPQTSSDGKLTRLAPIPLYSVDSVVRRSEPLQQTKDALAKISLHSWEAKRLQLEQDQMAWVVQEGIQSKMSLRVEIDDRIPKGAALVPEGIEATQTLGAPFGLVEIRPT